MRNAFTIDLEEWFCSHNLQAAIKPCDWDSLPLRAQAPTLRLLDMLEKRGVKATFFVLGWLADRCPELVQEIAAEGHEIASHGYAHLPTWLHTPESFDIDLKKAEASIWASTGARPALFRAPAFSITPQTLWAISVLKDNGFTADSSVFPLSWHPEYGYRGAKLLPFVHPNGLQEIPMSVISLAGLRIPMSGGAYFRLLPYNIYARMVRQLHRQGRPLVFYLHPWELDPQFPQVPSLSRNARFRHYTNLGGTEKKLDKLLKEFEFCSMKEVFDTHAQDVEA